MTIKDFYKIVQDNNIPDDVTMESDSGWQCCESDMDGVYYNEEEKRIIFTQNGDLFESHWYGQEGWKLLHSSEEGKHVNNSEEYACWR